MNKIIKEELIRSKETLPQHMAIIPDGNRRWAKKRGLPSWRGHLAGAENTKELVQTALDLGIPCFSFWLGSIDNLTKRPKKEINFLFKVYERYFHKLAVDKKIHKNQARVNVFGRWLEVLPSKATQSIGEAIKATQNYNQYSLNFFVAYNGIDEMVQAVRGVLKEGRKNKNLKVTPALIKQHLWTSDLPTVDFLIRTGSHDDSHDSAGFMMWNCANSQLYFAKEFYPDFGKEELIKAISDFQKRERRFGQ